MAEADFRKGRAIMNEETIDYRLTQIEKKLVMSSFAQAGYEALGGYGSTI